MQNDGALAGLPMMAVDPGGPVPQTVQVPKSLNNTAKAAIVVRFLLNEGTDLPLEDLPEDLQARLTQQMGKMGLIDRVTLDSVIAEFSDALDGAGLAFPNGIAGALSALDGKISQQTAVRLRKEAGVRRSGDPWVRLRSASLDEIIGITKAESIEVAAVLLSKLETGKAAELLGKLPGPLARRITYAVSQTEAVTPEAVDRIGLSLAAQLDDRPTPAFDDNPDERVGAILNQSTAKTRDDVLDSLDQTDADFATRVRKNIFTFADISVRVEPRDVPTVVRAIEPDILITALAGAVDEYTSGVAEFLLKNMSQRMAENLREEVADRGKPKPSDAEAAMNSIVGIIREMEQNGEIALQSNEDLTEDDTDE